MPYLNENTGSAEKSANLLPKKFFGADRDSVLNKANLSLEVLDHLKEVIPKDGMVIVEDIIRDVEGKKSRAEFEQNYEDVHKHEKTLNALRGALGK